MTKPTLGIAIAASLVVSAAPARAELVYFQSGRVLSVKGHRTEGDSLVLALRAGGEIVCDRSVIARIAPDEVPYPEPEQLLLKPEAGDANSSDRTRVQPDVPSQYVEIIDKVSAEQGVDPRLVKAVIEVESAYRQNARSHKGAMGLMQLMRETARRYAVANPYDPAANIEAGIKHLKSLLQRFTLPLALAAYNAGEAAVQRFAGIPPYPETREYVARILKLIG